MSSRRVAPLLLLLLSAAPARAGEMEVVPVVVNLGRDEKSAVVTIRNRSPEPARYQVSILAWDQRPDGEMKLTATGEMVAFPRTLSLAPNEAKIVRVGTTAPLGPAEKTYRLFIEELPPPAKPDQPSRVQVLSRVGIPVFLAPVGPVVEKNVVFAATVEGAQATFVVRNAGNVHVRPSAAKVIFRDEAGVDLGEKALDAWYVLAYGDRQYVVDVPADRCREVRRVWIEVTFPKETLRGWADAPRGACAP